MFKNEEGIQSVEKQMFNLRLMVKGFTKIKGENYNQIFSLRVKNFFIRILMFIANQYNMVLEH